MESEGLTDDIFKKLAYPYEYFNLEEMVQSLKITKKTDGQRQNKPLFPSEEDIQRTQRD